MSTETTAIAAYDPMFAAFGMEQGEPLKPSNIDLLQPITTADEPGLIAGRFRDAQSNMQFERMDIVVLKSQPGRVYFPPGSDRGSKPLCRSVDAIFPVINDHLIRQDNGRGCSNCSQSQWKVIGGKKIKPPCRDVINLLFVDVETEFVYRYNVKGTSITPVRDLRDTIIKAVGYAKGKGLTVPYHGIITRMESLRIKNNLGTFYNPKFTVIGNLLADPEKMNRIGQMAEYFNRSKTAGTEVEDPVDKVLDGEYTSQPQRDYEAA